jgi:hypothetical protein
MCIYDKKYKEFFEPDAYSFNPSLFEWEKDK